MLNALDLILLNLTILIVLMGSLITNYEKHMPVALIKLYRYGSFGYKGSGGNFLQNIEVPKYYYKHYYVFSSLISGVTLINMLLVYIFDFEVNERVKTGLRTIIPQKEPTVSVTAAIIGMGLIVMHCVRRWYESHFLQVFSSSGRINLCHYLAAFVHYTILVLAAVGQAPSFCGDQNRHEIRWRDFHTKTVLPCVILFLLASYEQVASNVILANLRKDEKTGSVVTEAHKVPRGRMFELISSPHRLCEILLYTAFVIIIPTKTMFFMWVWVFANQVQSAVHAHEWYKKTFKNYPHKRRAILPYFL